VRLVLHKVNEGGGSTRVSLLLSVAACPILRIILGRRSASWSSAVTATLRHRRPPVSIIVGCQALSSAPKVAEGEGVTWQWWWVLPWPLGVVAVRQKEGGRAYSVLTCTMHPVIAV
jgi:hypothetical protein